MTQRRRRQLAVLAVLSFVRMAHAQEPPNNWSPKSNDWGGGTFSVPTISDITGLNGATTTGTASTFYRTDAPCRLSDGTEVQCSSIWTKTCGIPVGRPANEEVCR